MIRYRECAKIYETNDETLFNLMENNRVIDDSNVSKIKESILEHGFLNQPILVSKDFDIIDGQHRFFSWKQIPAEKRPMIKFIIETSDEDAEKLCRLTNLVSKAWKDIDFIRFYANSDIDNKEDYQMIINLINYSNTIGFKTPIGFLLQLLCSTDSGKIALLVKEGQFKVTNEYDWCVATINRFMKFKPILDSKELSKNVFTHMPFRRALLKVLSTEEIDEERLLNTINLMPLTRCVSVDAYLIELENRYNKNKRKGKLKFTQ